MAQKSQKKQTFQERLQPILEKEQAVYDKAGIGRQFVISFPNRHKAPLLGRIGVKLLHMTGGIIQIQFHEVPKK